MNIDSFREITFRLEERLKLPLPGMSAQLEMAPKPIDMKRFEEQQGTASKAGGVNILLYPQNGDIYLPLMKRPSYPGVHSGQVSLPGGKFEEGDSSLIHTALRETEEEIGVSRSQMQSLGSLTDLFIIASNFKVKPLISCVSDMPDFKANETEVEQILLVSLTDLNNPEKRGVQRMKIGENFIIRSPYFDVEGEVVWGATAMILSEFLAVINPLMK